MKIQTDSGMPGNSSRNNILKSLPIFIFFLSAILLLLPQQSFSAHKKTAQAQPQAGEITVLAAETNKPVADAIVEIFEEGRERRLVKTATTGSDGKLQLSLPAGNYIYTTKARGYGITSSYIYLESGNRHVSSTWLNKAASLSGRLVDSSGKPLDGIRLVIDRMLNTTSDRDGRFRFEQLDAHGHDLLAEQKGWVFEKPQYPQLSAGENKDIGNLVLKREATVKARLKLTDTGKIATPAGITVTLSGNGVWKNIKTDSSGVALISGIPPGNYTVAVSDNRLLRVEKQISLGEGSSTDLAMEAATRPPSLEIEEYGDVFLPQKPLNMKVYGLWVTLANATVYRIPAERLLDGSVKLSSPSEINIKGLASEKTFKVQLRQAKNDSRNRGRFKLPPLPSGAYMLALEGGGTSARTAFLVTRLGLVGKISPEKIVLFASDLLTGSPLTGVKLHLNANGANSTRETSPDGTVEISRKEAGGLITGKRGSDLAFLPLVSEEAPERATEFKGYIYTERTAYRPGQKVFYKGVIRRFSGDRLKLPAINSVHLKVRDSGDKVLHEADVNISGKGSFNGSIDLPPRPALGEYSIVASSGGEQWQGSFKVMEYRKPEFEVKLRPQGQHHLAGSQVPVSISGRYYFGAPVAGGKVTWRAYTSPFASDPDDTPGGGFGEEREAYGGYGEFIGEGAALLDDSGEALLQIPAKSHDYPAAYQIEADITDSTSRQVTGSASFTVVPSLLDIRIRAEEYLLKPGQSTGFRVRVTDWQGTPQPNIPVKASISEYIYDKKSRNSSWKELNTILGTTGSDGAVRLTSSFPRTGYWKVTAQANDSADRPARQETTAWVWRSGSLWEGSYRELEAEFDKKTYRPGDIARLIVRSPAAGATLMLTLEGRRIHRRSMVALNSGVQVIEIPVTEELAPNIHISALAVHGGRFFQRNGLLKVDHEPGKLDVEVKPDRQVYAPGDTARITVKATTDRKPAKAELSLAVVDEAIFAVAPEKRDDIYRFFRGRREHLVTTIHSFPRLYLGGASKDAALKGEENELKGIKVRKVFKDTAGWFPLLDADAEGNAQAELQLPDNLTTWRATAVAHTDDSSFGSGQAKFISKLPFISRLSPPRFFVEGDSLQVPGTVTDTTGTEQEVTARFETTGLAITGDAGFKTRLAPGASIRRDVTVKAGHAGDATIKLMAKGSQGADALELSIPVLHRGITREIADSITVGENGGATTLQLPAEHMDGSAKITASFMPTASYSILPALERLIAFPYGCVEQTMSRFLPAAYAKTLLAKEGLEFPKALEARLPAILAEGMKRLEDFQHDDGGWGWWKDDRTSPELTAMVLSGFALANRAGLQTDEQKLKRGIKSAVKQMDPAKPLQTALLYRAMTAHGVKNEAAEKIISGAMDRMPLNGKIAWADALANTGRTAEATAVLDALKVQAKQDGQTSFITDESPRWRWGGSALETTAAMLSTMTRVSPGDPLLPRLAAYLGRRQAGGWWQNTAVSSAAVMALADFAGSAGETGAEYKAELFNNGVPVASWDVSKGRIKAGTQTVSIPASNGENRLEVRRSGKGGTAWVSLAMDYRVPPESASSSKGISLVRKLYRIKSVKNGDSWRHEYTELADGDSVKVGEDLEVRLIVSSDRDLEYLILEDRLPAGFEVRQADRDPRYSNEAWYRGWYDHKERRDSTMAWFMGWLPAGRHEFRSVIYPELAGSVMALPASIWPMYSPEIRSESAPWKAEVK